MSNEMKDWLNDKALEILTEMRLIDKVEFCASSYEGDKIYIRGWKDKAKVAFVVWFDDREHEWKFERREL